MADLSSNGVDSLAKITDCIIYVLQKQTFYAAEKKLSVLSTTEHIRVSENQIFYTKIDADTISLTGKCPAFWFLQNRKILINEKQAPVS